MTPSGSSPRKRGSPNCCGVVKPTAVILTPFDMDPAVKPRDDRRKSLGMRLKQRLDRQQAHEVYPEAAPEAGIGLGGVNVLLAVALAVPAQPPVAVMVVADSDPKRSCLRDFVEPAGHFARELR